MLNKSEGDFGRTADLIGRSIGQIVKEMILYAARAFIQGLRSGSVLQ